MTDVHKGAWVPVSVETLIDAGYWDWLSPDEQAAYLRDQEESARWMRSWRGRWVMFWIALADKLPHVHVHRASNHPWPR